MPGSEAILPPIFGFAAAIYLGLAVYVSRSSPQSVIGSKNCSERATTAASSRRSRRRA